MKYTYRDLVEKACETEFHNVVIDIDNHHIVLIPDIGCMRRYWSVYVDGNLICTRSLFDNGIRFAAKRLYNMDR